MLIFDSVTVYQINLALKTPFKTATGSCQHRPVLILRCVDRDGRVVYSECPAMPEPTYIPETIETAWQILTTYLLPYVIGRHYVTPQSLSDALHGIARGHDMAKASVEMASWALLAHQKGQSLSRLLGGTLTKIPGGTVIGIQSSPEALAMQVDSALRQGYQKIKLKIKPGHDLDYIDAALAVVHSHQKPSSIVMADANSAYTLADIEVLKQMDQRRLLMIEQPLQWDDIIDHAVLQSQLETPICLDEPMTTPDKARQAITLGSAKIINIKPSRVGGLTHAIAISRHCQSKSIPVWCGGMLESGIGRAYNVALSSLPHFTIPGDMSPSHRYWETDIVTPEWTMDAEGWVQVPVDQTGIGVTVDEAILNQQSARKMTVT